MPAEITTDAKVIPTLVARRLAAGATRRGRVPHARSPSSRARSAIAAQTAAAPDELLLALRGSGQALYVGLAEDAFVVASEPYGLVEETADVPPAWTARRRPTPSARRPRRGQVVCSTPSTPARSRASGAPRSTARRCRCRADELPARRDHHPRHRPRRLPALPAEGDLRGAGVVPQDPAREGRRARRAARRRARSRHAARRPPRPAARRRHPPGRGHRPGHRGDRRPEPGRRARPRSPTTSCAPRPSSPPSSRASSCADDMSDTLVVAISQSGTTTDTNRTVDLARARGATVVVDREPAQQRPRRQVRRRALHVRRARRRDGGAVDQGVLRADRRRRRSWPSPSPTRSTTLDPARACTSCSTPCARCPDAMDRVLGQRDAIAEIAPPARAVAPLLGGRRQRPQPHRRRRGADQALGALLQVDLVRRHRGQEAHRPLAPSR